MNLVAADVSPLILHWGSLSRLTSAATSQSKFMVPMHGVKAVGAFHKSAIPFGSLSPRRRSGRGGAR